MERSKKKLQLWKKAAFHFLLCFTMGFFTGFIPTGERSWTFFNHAVATTQSEFSLQPLEIPSYHNLNRSLLDGTHAAVLMRSNESSHTGTLKQQKAHLLGTDKSKSRRLVIIVTPTSVKKHLQIFQIVGFIQIFLRVFGTWPLAFLSANRERVIIEGPVCDSSQVIGWHFKKQKNDSAATTGTNKSPLHISSFAFNSSILWDPERWGRPSSIQDTSQKTMKFVEKEVLEEETEVKGIPAEGCSKIMLWNLLIPTKHPHPTPQ